MLVAEMGTNKPSLDIISASESYAIAPVSNHDHLFIWVGRHSIEAVGLRHRPARLVKSSVGAAIEQAARCQEAMNLRDEFYLRSADPAKEVVRAELIRMFDPGRRQHFRQGHDGIAMKIVDPLRLVGNDERALAELVLRGYAGGAAVGVAALGLDAADCEHEAPGAIHPVGADCKYARHVERADDLAARAETDLVAQVDSNERVVNEK